jgi:hypothetical protein
MEKIIYVEGIMVKRKVKNYIIKITPNHYLIVWGVKLLPIEDCDTNWKDIFNG